MLTYRTPNAGFTGSLALPVDTKCLWHFYGSESKKKHPETGCFVTVVSKGVSKISTKTRWPTWSWETKIHFLCGANSLGGRCKFHLLTCLVCTFDIKIPCCEFPMRMIPVASWTCYLKGVWEEKIRYFKLPWLNTGLTWLCVAWVAAVFLYKMLNFFVVRTRVFLIW